jgi:asparagine synthase (glutamine-hydrolysing)
MCGLAGYIDFGSQSSPEILERMTNTLHHRGPDDGGFEYREHGEARIGFGFRRLSIIDLSDAGHQPMVNEVNGDVIVFNGEVYNYREIRKELEEKGHRFRSNSDTEVVLRSFQEWGVLCVDRFVGMFTIVIFNPSTGKIYFFNDRPGIKPLYYYWDGSLFLFASELKAFHQHPGFKKEIDYDTLGLYFLHGYIPAPYCIFKNCAKIEPGYLIEFDLPTRKLQPYCYWNIRSAFNKPKLDLTFDEASEELEKILVKAFQYRMVADVPVGVFLSGGYDSSCVTALLQKNMSSKLKTFTISFDNPEFDEGSYAASVARHLGTDHHDYRMKESDALELIPLLPDIYDEPMSDGGAIPNILVSKLAAQKVKVVISADGGDEIFAGYSKHLHLREKYKQFFIIPGWLKRMMVHSIGFVNRFRSTPLYEFDRLSRLRTFLDARDASTLFDRYNQTFTEEDVPRLMKPRYQSLYSKFMNDHLLDPHNDEIDRITAVDFQTFLAGDILPKVDRATSFASIEGREPLLDHNIVEFAARLPSEYKLRGDEGKAILRDVVHKHVPRNLVERKKQGFGLPLHEWANNELKPQFDELFDAKFIKQQDIFHESAITGLYRHYRSGHKNSLNRIYEIFVFQQWFKRWMM